MDNRTILIWYNEVYKSSIADADGKAGLLLDDLICHKPQELSDKLANEDYLLYIIPTHYTRLLQPSEAGINKSLKDCLKNYDEQWRRSKHSNLNLGQKLHALKRTDTLNWFKEIRE